MTEWNRQVRRIATTTSAGREADPEADRAQARVEGQDLGDRQPDDPVRDEVREHGQPRVAGAAQGSRHRGLRPVEDLEERRDPEQRHGRLDDGGVVGEEARELRAGTSRG